MKRLFIGFLFGSISFLASATDWYIMENTPSVKVDIDFDSIGRYKGKVVGGGNPLNYMTTFVRFSYKPGSQQYDRGDASITYQYLSDCNNNMSTVLSGLYRDVNGNPIRTATLIEVLNQNDFKTPYPNTVNQGVISLLCYVNSKENEKR